MGVANRNDEPTPRLYKPAKPKIPQEVRDEDEIVEQECIEETEHAAESMSKCSS